MSNKAEGSKPGNQMDYLDLWKYFQERADLVKEAMFKTLTWLVGFAAALLGFIFAILTNYDGSQAAISLNVAVLAAAAAGIFICLYAVFMLLESGKHIRGNWKRADRAMREVSGLDLLVLGYKKSDKDERAETRKDPFLKALWKKTKKSPWVKKLRKRTQNIWIRLLIIVVMFAASFVGILLWRLAALFTSTTEAKEPSLCDLEGIKELTGTIRLLCGGA